MHNCTAYWYKTQHIIGLPFREYWPRVHWHLKHSEDEKTCCFLTIPECWLRGELVNNIPRAGAEYVQGICTRRLTPWLRRVLRVSVGVLIPTGTRRTPISARAHLQLGGSLVPRSTRLWLKLPRPYSLGLRALVMTWPTKRQQQIQQRQIQIQIQIQRQRQRQRQNDWKTKHVPYFWK